MAKKKNLYFKDRKLYNELKGFKKTELKEFDSYSASIKKIKDNRSKRRHKGKQKNKRQGGSVMGRKHFRGKRKESTNSVDGVIFQSMYSRNKKLARMPRGSKKAPAQTMKVTQRDVNSVKRSYKNGFRAGNRWGFIAALKKTGRNNNY